MLKERFLVQILMPTLGIALLVSLLAWPSFYPRDLLSGVRDLIALERPDHLEMTGAVVLGVDGEGRRFELTADHLLQESSDSPRLTFGAARFALDPQDGQTMEIETQGGGEFDRRARLLRLTGGVTIRAGPALSFDAATVEIDVFRQRLYGFGAVRGNLEGSDFAAEGIVVEGWGDRVRLESPLASKDEAGSGVNRGARGAKDAKDANGAEARSEPSQ